MPDQITINGQKLEKPPGRYKPGHVCSPQETEILNALLLDRVKANLAKRRDSYGVLTQEDLISYYNAYQLGVGTERDPIETEALKIARITFISHLNRQGKTTREIEKETFEKRIRELAQNENIRKEASRRVALLSELMIEDLGL